MNKDTSTRQRGQQVRAALTRGKIAAGATQVLAHAGVHGLTHRAVARAAGVSLAATTYHFDTKAEIIEETSRTLLAGYLDAFSRMQGRIAAGIETGISGLDDLVERVVVTALGRERTRSLAWCELVLHGGRSVDARALAQCWYRELDSIWHSIAEAVKPSTTLQQAGTAVDLTVGLTFLLQPFGLDQAAARQVVAGRLDVEELLATSCLPTPARSMPTARENNPAQKRYAQTRQKLIDAAIAILVDEGAAGMSHRRVAEVAGMARSGPTYYFPTIEGLLETAQMALFERAKARYRSALASLNPAEMGESRLLDLTTAIYFREALEFGRENIGYYSGWMSAAQNPSLRPAVASLLLDQHRAWARRLVSVWGRAPAPVLPLRLQATFVGKLVRTITASPDVADLSTARESFAAALRQPGAGRED